MRLAPLLTLVVFFVASCDDASTTTHETPFEVDNADTDTVAPDELATCVEGVSRSPSPFVAVPVESQTPDERYECVLGECPQLMSAEQVLHDAAGLRVSTIRVLATGSLHAVRVFERVYYRLGAAGDWSYVEDRSASPLSCNASECMMVLPLQAPEDRELSEASCRCRVGHYDFASETMTVFVLPGNCSHYGVFDETRQRWLFGHGRADEAWLEIRELRHGTDGLETTVAFSSDPSTPSDAFVAGISGSGMATVDDMLLISLETGFGWARLNSTSFQFSAWAEDATRGQTIDVSAFDRNGWHIVGPGGFYEVGSDQPAFVPVATTVGDNMRLIGLSTTDDKGSLYVSASFGNGTDIRPVVVNESGGTADVTNLPQPGGFIARGPPIVATDGLLFYGRSGLALVNPDTFEPVWELEGPPVAGPPTLTDGRLLVVDRRGTIHEWSTTLELADSSCPTVTCDTSGSASRYRTP